MDDQSTEFDLASWATEFELSAETLNVLTDSGFTSRRRLSKLNRERINEFFKDTLRPTDIMMLEEATESLQSRILNAQVAVLQQNSNIGSAASIENSTTRETEDEYDSSSEDEFVLAEEEHEEIRDEINDKLTETNDKSKSLMVFENVTSGERIVCKDDNVVIPVPSKPEVSALSVGGIDVQWHISDECSKSVIYYEIKCQSQDNLRWTSIQTEGREQHCVYSGLKPGSQYKFKVCAVTNQGFGTFGPVSDIVHTHYPAPAKPTEKEKSFNSITVTWDWTKHQSLRLLSLSVRYRVIGNSDWFVQKVFDDASGSFGEEKYCQQISGLLSNTSYEFQLYVMNPDGYGAKGPISDVITTLLKEPNKPIVNLFGKNNAKIKWNRPEGDFLSVTGYEIRHRSVRDKIWQISQYDANVTECDILNLEEELTYEFQICIRYQGKRGPYSKTEIIATKRLRPSYPRITSTCVREAFISWCKPQRDSHVVKYEVHFKRADGGNWSSYLTNGSTRYIVRNLEAGTYYHFRVRALYEIWKSKWSAISKEAATKQSFAQILVRKMQPHYILAPPALYKIPMEKIYQSTKGAKIRKLMFGKSRVGTNEKTIMMVGATGSGKSTLIEAMINYVFDVSWSDNFRFTVIELTDDEKVKAEHQSQTEWITNYTINVIGNSNVPFNLTIIDTPGFGDTQGIVRDQEIFDQIKTFLTTKDGIQMIDAICLVVPASLPRLTASQKYIFASVLSMFGHDITENIFPMFTFAAHGVPASLTALRADKIACKQWFAFDNSAVFARNDDTSESSPQLLWDMGSTSFQNFFQVLQTTPKRSLVLTKDVLNERENLEITVKGLQTLINETVQKMETLRQEKPLLDEPDEMKQKDIDEGHIQEIKLPKDVYATNCKVCKRTCHCPCTYSESPSANYFCKAMYISGSCSVCPSRCSYKNHEISRYKYEMITVKEHRTSEDVKQKYSSIKSLEEEFLNTAKKLTEMLQKVKLSIDKLNRISLRPSPLHDVEYLDMLIEVEKEEEKPGFSGRYGILKSLKEDAELISTLDEDNQIPWEKIGIDQKMQEELEKACEGYGIQVKKLIVSPFQRIDGKIQSY